MLCAGCAHWTVGVFSYSALEERWNQLIGGPITPGYKDKFSKESEKLSTDFNDTRLHFKYCSKGNLSRFYIMRKPEDTQPKKVISKCASFSTVATALEGVSGPDPLWRLCTTESHGTSRVHEQVFYPGLYEKMTYFRIPAHRGIRPLLGVSGECVVCDSHFEKGIMVQEQSHFCSNKHYLEWWRLRNPELFVKINKQSS